MTRLVLFFNGADGLRDAIAAAYEQAANADFAVVHVETVREVVSAAGDVLGHEVTLAVTDDKEPF